MSLYYLTGIFTLLLRVENQIESQIWEIIYDYTFFSFTRNSNQYKIYLIYSVRGASTRNVCLLGMGRNVVQGRQNKHSISV